MTVHLAYLQLLLCPVRTYVGQIYDPKLTAKCDLIAAFSNNDIHRSQIFIEILDNNLSQQSLIRTLSVQTIDAYLIVEQNPEHQVIFLIF